MRLTDRGWALVSVLWVVAMLAMLATATQLFLVTSAKGEQHATERAEIDAALDAALTRAILGLGDQRLDQRWPVDGTPRAFRYADMDIEVSIQDQLGLIDLNAADGSMIKRLLKSAGLANDDADILTDHILDWRGAATLKSLHGASDQDYAAAQLPYHQRHGAFQSVPELRLVLGITPALYARIAPALTVYSNRPAFDPSLAPKEVLEALYLDTPDQADAILATRNSPARTAANTLPLAGRCFSITATITRGKLHFTRTTVIELTGDDDKPYLIFAWE